MLVFDYAIIGGGVVGLTGGVRWTVARIVLIEKEPELTPNQTGQNAGLLKQRY
jgi:L-2-hydroxyglutarate oxidase LhgO